MYQERPIYSSVNHLTSRISKLFDEQNKDYVPKTKSYIRDTQDFIKKIKQLGSLTDERSYACVDVSSLYTNIPNHEGILAVTDKLRHDPSENLIANFILDLLKLILHNMDFTFIDYLNSLHETIKFTHEMRYSQIDFLDTTIKFTCILNILQPIPTVSFHTHFKHNAKKLTGYYLKRNYPIGSLKKTSQDQEI